MTNFWIIVAGMLSVSTLIILWPILPFNRKKPLQSHLGQKQDNIDIFKDRLQELESEKNQGNLDEQTFEQLKTELEKSLLVDVEDENFEPVIETGISGKQWMMSCFMALLIAVSSLTLYFKLGRSDDFAHYLTLQQEKGTGPDSNQGLDLNQAIAQLEAKLQQDPSDAEKWYLLAKSYSAIGQYEKSAQVFSKIAEMIGQDDPNYPAIIASYAQSLYMASGEKMTSEVKQTVNKALSADPMEPNALLLLGLEAYSQEDYKKAITYWQNAKQKAGAEQQQQFLDPAILSAQEKLIESSEMPIDTTASVASTAATITINLDIAKELKKQVSADQTIFVYARASGQRIPLAAERLQTKDLPAKIELNDSKAVMPTAKLSSAKIVDITARVSFSGQAMAQPGDLYATIEKVAVVNNEKALELLIDQVVR